MKLLRFEFLGRDAVDHVGVVIQQVQRRELVVLQFLADINARQIPGHLRGDVTALLDGEIIRLGLWCKRRLRFNYSAQQAEIQDLQALPAPVLPLSDFPVQQQVPPPARLPYGFHLS